MKLNVCGKEYDCGDLTIAKYKQLNKVLEAIEEYSLFKNPMTDEGIDELVNTIVIMTDGDVTEEKLKKEGDVVDMLLAVIQLQAEAVSRHEQAIKEMNEHFFSGGGDPEPSTPQP